jgi:hypothetical protein
MTAKGNFYEAPRRPAGSRAAYGEESAESLRRRAEALLDEMMLGAVDGGVVEYGAPPGGSWRASGQSPEVYRPANDEWPPLTGRTEQTAQGNIPGNGSAYGSGIPPAADRNGYHVAGDEPIQTDGATAAHADTSRTGGGAPPEPAPGSGAPLVSAEERYMHVGGGGATGRQEANGSTDYGMFSASAVRRQSSMMASTMTVGVRAGSRSPLLPRSTDVDIEALLEEIGTLRSDIAHALPPGQEAGERSRHLLNKAQNLLQSDPARSAEVDYYLQQVRRTLLRARQTREWSAIYRHRMTIYLLGWLLLAITVIAGLVLFQTDVQAFVQGMLDLPIESPVVAFAAMVAATMFAGALGAAVAILLNMGRHARQKYGYFDRKFGLRCLLLPILGLFFGFLVGGAWSLVYFFVGIDPVNAFYAWLAPLLLGFLVGFGQEWLYGAR